ncbi:TadE family type IV pilus minor pilin [Nakamurella endophytica]|uniref:Pilus assembly protein TadE n=1 Tax=Nakamurella endophytica TaxID=1748367 RepID=A0A917SZT2_9ACTN|nr:TadE family type IV pilus minor pilin [Nakamurella endophytica]GGM05332.1 hypothetical protein GCM10011594_26940 [Nakamurella endophytica]
MSGAPVGADGRVGDRGGVTVEAAVALAALVVVLAGCLAGLACVLGQLRCTDAAREAARLAGRGDEAAARQAVAQLAPSGAVLGLSVTGDLVTADVSVGAVGGLLPGVRLRAAAVAAREDAVDDGAPS